VLVRYPRNGSCSNNNVSTSTLFSYAARCIGVYLVSFSRLTSQGRVSIILLAIAESKSKAQKMVNKNLGTMKAS
jgi:hypothetical protein